jgi:hypothetical protein
VSRAGPRRTCTEVLFGEALAVGASGLVALEDYARAVARALDAEAIPDGRDPGSVVGVHLCEPAGAPTGPQRADVEAFARGLAERAGEGLGWS